MSSEQRGNSVLTEEKNCVEGAIGAPPCDFLGEFCAGIESIPDWEGVHGERYVYARYLRDDYEFLHDLEKDPDQLINLASNPEYEAILETMRKRCNEEVELRGGAFTEEELSPRVRKKKPNMSLKQKN